MAGGSKEKGRKVLAWFSFLFALVSGAAAAATFVGGAISGLLGLLPAFVAAIALAAAVISMGLDIFNDLEPNQLAVYCALALPTLARSVPGKLSDNVTQLSNQALGSVSGQVGTWFGVTSVLGVAAICAVVALLMARRVVRKGR